MVARPRIDAEVLDGLEGSDLVQVRDGAEAVDRARQLYDSATAYLRDKFSRFASGEPFEGPVRACYPLLVLIADDAYEHGDPTASYGFFPARGVYSTTLSRPGLFKDYLSDQIDLILSKHSARVYLGHSHRPIPLHFAFPAGFHVEGDLDPERLYRVRDYFDLPNLSTMNDAIANGDHITQAGEPLPLSLFPAERIDYSLHRLRHYTATGPDHFQQFVLFTNYPFYIEEFVAFGQRMMEATTDPEEKAYRSQYTAFVEPGEVITYNQNLTHTPPTGRAPDRLPQMPAYHLQRADGSGITMVNIGIGPSNAKTATDHIAVLRPHAWLMLGHCAGLRNTQKLGDYVLAHGYLREDHVLDADLPSWVPVPALSEIQLALEDATSEVCGVSGKELKRVMRTGTVATIDNRNWELRDDNDALRRFSKARAIALDMESATIAGNGLRFRVPYGTLLCVSDKPLHGELKLPGMANNFYRERVSQHLQIGLRAMELLREGRATLHSRKLRTFQEPAMR